MAGQALREQPIVHGRCAAPEACAQRAKDRIPQRAESTA